MSQLGRMPDDIPPKVFDNVCREYIVSNSSKTIGPFMDKQNYEAFRKLIDGYDKNLRGSFAKSLDYKVGTDLKTNFLDYIFDSLAPVGVCGQMFEKGGCIPLFYNINF